MSAPAHGAPRRVLVLRPRALGDVLLATPALRALRQGLPQAEIHVAVDDVLVPVLRRNPHVDRLWALPRRGNPRTRVPAGSVAIAAGQTAIYPVETPGGWHLLGRTKVRPFDESRAEPSLLRPGDRVVFRSITREEFDRAAD